MVVVFIIEDKIEVAPLNYTTSKCQITIIQIIKTVNAEHIKIKCNI